MKSRPEIKALAKEAMSQQRGASILTLLVVWLIATVGGILGGIPFLGVIIVWGTAFFIDFPLIVNMEGVYIKIYNRIATGVGEIFSNFSVNYLRKVGGMCWMTLFIYLWSLLFVIPGIVKTFAYSMTPYILADCPNVDAKQALKLSMRMTNGYKAELFIMSLSFIGWLLLSALTFGILWIVYVGPYMYTTWAGYYLELRDRALASGTVEQWELE